MMAYSSFRYTKTLRENPKKHCREKPPVSYSPFCKPVYKSKPVVLRSAVILQNCFLLLSGNELSHTVSGMVVSAS